MRMRSIVGASVLVVLLMLASFWCGVRFGAETSLLVDSVPRGSISLFHLEGLSQGKTQNMVIGLEADIDVALIQTDRLEQHLLYPWLEPVWGFPVSSTSQMLTRLANYRQTHPSPLGAAAITNEPLPTDPERAAFTQEIRRGAAVNEQVIARVIERYATKPVSQESTPKFPLAPSDVR